MLLGQGGCHTEPSILHLSPCKTTDYLFLPGSSREIYMYMLQLTLTVPQRLNILVVWNQTEEIQIGTGPPNHYIHTPHPFVELFLSSLPICFKYLFTCICYLYNISDALKYFFLKLNFVHNFSFTMNCNKNCGGLNCYYFELWQIYQRR